MEPVSEHLVDYLTSIDERLLYYLDQDDELMFDTVERLGESTPAALELRLGMNPDLRVK